MNDNDATYRPVLRTQADLEQAWLHLLGPRRFHQRSAWLMTIEADGRPFPHLTEFDGVPEGPDPVLLGWLGDLLRPVFDELPPARLAFLVSRPGYRQVELADRLWADALHGLARELALPCEVVHLATDDGLIPLPLDELGACAG